MHRSLGVASYEKAGRSQVDLLVQSHGKGMV